MIQDFVTAIIEGNRALYEDQAFFDRVVDKWMPGNYTAAQNKLLCESHRPSWGVNGGLNLEVMGHALQDWKARVKASRAKNPYFGRIEDLVDTHFAREALGKLGGLQGSLDDPQRLH